jgi:hypothetical protein
MNRATFALTALLMVAAAQLSVRAQSPAQDPAIAEEGFDGLVIRVYDMTGIDRTQRTDAISAAAAILANAGVEAEWLDCRRHPGSTTSPCDAYRRPTDLIVRIMRGSLDGEHEDRRALGVSIVDPSARSGVLATIFVDRLAPVVRRTGVDATVLLARTLAHEVGHLLLRTSDHVATGLMRATWTDMELARNRPEDWVFAQALR